ncbi:hypothetical protein HY484_01535, partial [Candidatus Woesearchaeota archaeon]|nr:hypothetical protein [Candidatus Woesearchaeota archaeon]
MQKKKQRFNLFSYTKTTFWDFIEHVIPTKQVLLSTIYDTIFWLLFFGTTYVLGIIINKEAIMLKNINFNQQAVLAQGIAQANITLIKTFVAKMAFYVIIYLLIIALFYTLMKGMIWLTLLHNKKYTKQYFKQFYKLNLLWGAIWLAIFVFVLIGVQAEYRNNLAIIAFVLYLHTTTVLQATFKNTIKEAINAVVMTGIGKIHYFILPYAFSAIIYWLLTRLLMFIPTQTTAIIVAAMLIALFYLSWFRNYVKDVVLKIE